MEDQQKIDEQLVRIMVRQNASTCFFDDEDLQNFVKKSNPGHKIHERRHFTTVVIPKMANSIRSKILEQIGKNKFAITSDGWQKPSKFPALQRFFLNATNFAKNITLYLSITTHTVTDDFQRLDDVFATIVVENEHTGEAIANLIENCLVENGLSISSVTACVRDDAKNMAKSCRLLAIDRFRLINFLNLIIK